MILLQEISAIESEMPSSKPPLVTDMRSANKSGHVGPKPEAVNEKPEVSESKFRIRRDKFIRTRRGRKNMACDMMIAIDEPLYVTYNRDLKNLTKMVKEYVKQLNNIYHR